MLTLCFNLYILWFKAKKIIFNQNPSIKKCQSFKKHLEKMGPLFIKIGQFISVRPDIFSVNLIKEMSQLQDKATGDEFCPIFILEKELGKNAFKYLNKNPIAKASIAHVYEAKTHSNNKVVVKIVKPNAKKTIINQIFYLKMLINIFALFSKKLSKLKKEQMIDAIEKNLMYELNMHEEAKHAILLKKQNIKNLQIPQIYSKLSTKNILTMEHMQTVSINSSLNIDKNKILAKKGVEIFLEQVFSHNLFHADMHLGNIFLNPNLTSFVAVDFGMVGYLRKKDLFYISTILLALTNKDFDKVASYHKKANWVPKDVDERAMSIDIEYVCAPIIDKAIGDYSAAELLINIIKIAKKYSLKNQPQLLLLQKTLISVEGIGRQLDPKLKFWNLAGPIIKKYLHQNYMSYVNYQNFIDDLIINKEGW